MKKKISCSVSDVTASVHKNRMILEGCLTKIGSPSQGAPCGADGKRVIFSEQAVKECADSFIGQPLNCVWPDEEGFSELAFSDHGSINIGYINDVKIVDDKLMASIVVWKNTFPEEANLIIKSVDSLGFSVEWYPTETHEDGDLIVMDKFVGVGCAILWKDCAAFKDTFIERLAAAKAKKRSDVVMTDEEKKELADGICAAIKASVDERFAKIDEALKASAEGSISKDELESIGNALAEIKDGLGKCGEEIEALKAANEAKKDEPEGKNDPEPEPEDKGDDKDEEDDKDKDHGGEGGKIGAADEGTHIPAPKAGQHIADNPMLAGDEGKSELDKIMASEMDPAEKIKQITKLRYKG